LAVFLSMTVVAAAADWHAMTAAEFAGRPEVQARIDFTEFNPALRSTFWVARAEPATAPWPGTSRSTPCRFFHAALKTGPTVSIRRSE